MENDDPPPTSSGRKVKFAPSAIPRRRPQPKPKTEDDNDEENAAQTQNLLRRATEQLGKRGNKAEKNSSVQVAFGPGEKSSESVIRTYGVPKTGNTSKRHNSEPEVSDNEEPILPLPMAMDVEEDGTINTESSVGATDATPVVKKDYKEPWDFHHSLYPTILPQRMPYSGDPELLNETEFGEAATDKEYDENDIVPAIDLGLLEEHGENRLYFFQLPFHLPLSKNLASAQEREKVGCSKSSENSNTFDGDLKRLPAGYMGKLLIYKSGAVKLKLGDIDYDVDGGIDCSFAQNFVAINTEEGHCCELGDAGKRAVVAPNIDSLLNSLAD